LARKRRKTGGKAGSGKATAGEPSEAGPAHAAAPGKSDSAVVPKRTIWVAMTVAAAAVFAFGVAFHLLNGTGPASPPQRPAIAAFVGSETCAGCHQAEAKLWNTSQHKAAMQHATDKTVLGNFSDARFDYYGVASRFFRKDGKFLVETDGTDGKACRVRGEVHLRRRSIATIPCGIS